MNYGYLLGKIIEDSEEPIKTVDILMKVLTGLHIDEADLRANAIDPQLIDVVRMSLPDDPSVIVSACQQGLAWIEGRKSAERTDFWHLVATVPPDIRAPSSLHHETGETIVQLINRTHSSLKLISPFLDERAMNHLKTPIITAIDRGVIVTWMVTKWTQSVSIMFRNVFGESAMNIGSQGLKILTSANPYPWPHLKVVLSDDTEAYIGSANITTAAFEGRNIELGVLIKGKEIATIKEIMEIIPFEPVS